MANFLLWCCTYVLMIWLIHLSGKKRSNSTSSLQGIFPFLLSVSTTNPSVPLCVEVSGIMNLLHHLFFYFIIHVYSYWYVFVFLVVVHHIYYFKFMYKKLYIIAIYIEFTIIIILVYSSSISSSSCSSRIEGRIENKNYAL